MWKAPLTAVLLVVSLAASVSADPIPEIKWRSVKIDTIEIGYGLQMADVMLWPVRIISASGSDQIVVGWHAMNDPGVPGIKLFTPLDKNGTKWQDTRISAEKVAVEDIKVADLNGDGKVDIVAAARQTKNLVIFFNER